MQSINELNDSYLIIPTYSILASGSTDSSVGRALDSGLQSHGFDPHPGCSVESLSKTLHPHCLVLVRLRKLSQNDLKIVDRDEKPQTKILF